MTNMSPGDRDEYEAAINALVDGELDEAASAELKAAAAADRELAQAIVDAWRLQQGLEALRLERAPARLTRRLRRIPAGQRPSGAGLRWPGFAAGALAGIALAAFAMLMITVPKRSADPVPAPGELAQAEAARRDLAIAFHYLDKVGARTGREIRDVLHDNVAEPVTGEVSRHLPYTGHSRKEEHS